jgi:hypothetical protein
MRKPAMTRDEAEAIAYAGLAMLAGEQERMGRFFGLSGLDPAQIRELAPTAAFQTALIAHIRGDESLLLAFAANQGLDPAQVGQAEQLLSGQLPHFTGS